MVKKHKIALFIKPQGETSYTRIKKSTSLTLSMNPVETEYDYIADENPTTEIEQYKPSIDQDLTMYKNQPDYEMLWTFFYEMKTGTDAHCDCMVVFMQEGNNTDGYAAWHTDSVISVQDLNAVEKKLNVKVLFAGNIEKGTAKMVDGVPTFEKSTVVS